MTAMKVKWVLIFGLVLACLVPSPVLAKSIAWLPLDQGVQQARQKQRFVLVHFYADWCHDCHTMANEMNLTPALSQRLNQSFVTVRLPQKGKRQITYQGKVKTEAQWVRHFRPSGFPTLMFLSPDGQEIGKMSGYIAPAELAKLLDFVQSRAYQKMNFETYLKQAS